MRPVLIACLVSLVAPAVAQAQDASIVSRDIPLAEGGRTVASARSTPRFDMVGLHWRGAGAVEFRTRSTSGRWSGWRSAEPEPEDRPDVGTEARVTGWRLGNPWWTGPSDRLEVRARGAVSRVRAWYVWSTAARIPLRGASVARSPAIIPRRNWSADEKAVRAAPRYAPVLRLAIVHHTAGSNAYGPADSAAIVKGIQLYHVKANGWNDIGYNFLVDRYGQVFEGRGGGIDRNVIGAHAEGFNTGSAGVALIGTYGSSAPSKQAEQALAALLSWRLDVAHVDPAASSMVASGGNPKFRAGAPVFLRDVSGHRDTGFTSCPGDALYARLGAITEVVATTGLPKLYEPRVQGVIGKTVRFSARLSQPLAWAVTVTGSDGSRVAVKRGTGDRISWSWNSAGVSASGRYTWTIEAGGVRPARGVVGSTTVTSPPPPPPPPPASGLGVAPGVVSPNGDGYQDTATVRYTLSEPSTVSVSVADERGQMVAALLLGVRQKAGVRTARLDPAVVPDGSYRLVVEVRGDSGRLTRLTSALAVNRTLGWLRADPAQLTPDGDGIGDVIAVSFEVTASAQVTAEVRAQGSQLGIVFADWLDPGSHVVLWNGAAPSGALPPGSYEIWVTAANAVGVVSQKVAVTIAAPLR